MTTTEQAGQRQLQADASGASNAVFLESKPSDGLVYDAENITKSSTSVKKDEEDVIKKYTVAGFAAQMQQRGYAASSSINACSDLSMYNSAAQSSAASFMRSHHNKEVRLCFFYRARKEKFAADSQERECSLTNYNGICSTHWYQVFSIAFALFHQEVLSDGGAKAIDYERPYFARLDKSDEQFIFPVIGSIFKAFGNDADKETVERIIGIILQRNGTPFAAYYAKVCADMIFESCNNSMKQLWEEQMSSIIMELRAAAATFYYVDESGVGYELDEKSFSHYLDVQLMATFVASNYIQEYASHKYGAANIIIRSIPIQCGDRNVDIKVFVRTTSVLTTLPRYPSGPGDCIYPSISGASRVANVMQKYPNLCPDVMYQSISTISPQGGFGFGIE